MSEQPEALRLADLIDNHDYFLDDVKQAAAELRRLHVVNQELLEALKTITLMCESVGDFSNGVTDPTGTIDEGVILSIRVIKDARAVITKAEGQA